MGMQIDIVCTDPRHPVQAHLVAWKAKHQATHRVNIVQRVAELAGGDLLFLISCHEIVRADIRARYAATLVVHASDLPLGRGWSPLVWQILEGKNDIPVTLLEAVDSVDAGPIWAQTTIHLRGHELIDEINAALFAAELELMDRALVQFEHKTPPRQQDTREPTFYRRRTPRDSELDPNRPLAEQFDLLRVSDPDRYPAFFQLRGHRYAIRITREDPDADA